MKERVLVIGLDGATFKLVKPWIEEGKLPVIANLMKEGVYGDLLSTPDMMSPAAWTSFSTGKNPGKHGIYNFMDLIPGTFKFRYYNSTHRDGETIWSLLNKTGKKVGVLNVPMSYPADKVDGFMVTGWNAPTITSEGFSYPPELINELLAKFGDYPLFPTVKKHIVEGRPDLAVEELYRHIEIMGEATKYLMQNREWDFLVSVFITTDQVQHYFWQYMDPKHPDHDPEQAVKYKDVIYNVYKKCDDVIGELIKTLDENTTVIVMSDHGFGCNFQANMYLQQWLEKMDLSKKAEAAQVNILRGGLNFVRNLFGKALKSAYNFLNEHLSIKAKGFLNSLFPSIRDRIESAWRFSGYDWSKTKAFFHYEPRINLKGRDPFGIVNPGKEYDDLLDYISRKLYECTDAKTGERVVEKVFKGKDLFHGKFADRAPDLIIWWKEDLVVSGLVCTKDDGTRISATEMTVKDHRSGNHTPYGIFIAKGKNIRKGEEIKNAKIIDVAPSILHLMNEPIPKDMDGSVLIDIFNEKYIRERSVKFAEDDGTTADKSGGYSDDDEKMVQEHLRNLGYVE